MGQLQVLIGRALGRPFVGLLISSNLGWSGYQNNVIFNDISHLKGEDGEYNYSHLTHDHHYLENCCQFHPSNILLR